MKKQDINQIRKEAENTLKITREWKKKYGKFQPLSESVEHRIKTVKTVIELCKKIKEMEKEIKTIQDAFDFIK